MYPLAMSDMRLLDSKVSTTWCQVSNNRLNFLKPYCVGELLLNYCRHRPNTMNGKRILPIIIVNTSLLI